MAINWNTVETQIEQAVSGIVGGAWQNAGAGASAQFAAIIAVGKQIEQDQESNAPAMQQPDYDSLKLMQQRALDGVLQTYVGISLDIAQQAAGAAWNVLVNAVKTAYPATALIL